MNAETDSVARQFEFAARAARDAAAELARAPRPAKDKALTAAAAALAKKGAESAARRPQQPGEPGTDANGAGTLTDVIIAAALDGARRLLDKQGDAAPAEPEVVEAPPALEASTAEPGAKRRRAGASGRAAPQDA